MSIDLIIEMVIGIVGGLGLFLFGMKQMSEGMQAIAGEKLRGLISKITDNRYVACGVGTTVTALIQSSSVTTVMVVGMVNAGIMTLKQSIGVIMGGNIGTTITAWLIALKVADYGLPILGVSAFFFLFTKNEKIRYTAMMFLGLGMVFFGLELMKGGFLPLREDPKFVALFAMFQPDSYLDIIKIILIGAGTTALIQSSSATVAITITLAKTGIIGYDTAVALVLGENIGTTITAYLSSLGATTNAKRAAYAHITINVVGVFLMVPLFHQYIGLLNHIIPQDFAIAGRIALAHSAFNIFIVSILILLINQIARFVTLIAPDKTHKEIPHLTYLDVRMYSTPALGIQQSYQELIRMSVGVSRMSNWLRESLTDSKTNKDLENKIFHREKIFDIIQKEIVEFISHILTGNLPQNVTNEARKQIRIADEYESISDYITIILKLNLKIKNNNLNFTEQGKTDILDLHDSVSEYIEMINSALTNKNSDILSKAQSKGDMIHHKVKDIKEKHLIRLSDEQTNPLKSLIYVDMISSYRRIKDHTLNIAEVLAGEK